MLTPFFSVVIPVYNAESTILDTLRSIESQNYKDFEVVLVNDGSTDNSEMLIKKFIHTYNNYQLFTINNSGPGSARNVGIEKASGVYLIFADADDFFKPNAFEQRFLLLEKKNPDFLVTSFKTSVKFKGEIINERETVAPNQSFESNQEFRNKLFKLMEKQLMYVVWNKVYKLSIIKKYDIKFPPYKSCEDRLFNLAYIERINSAITSKEVLYDYYFEGENSLTNRYFDNKFETFVEFYLTCVKLVPKDKSGFSSLFLKGVVSSIIPIHAVQEYSLYEKMRYINRIVKNKYVIDAVKISNTDTPLRKGLVMLFKIKSKYLMYFITKILFKISNLSPKHIEKIKGNF